MKPKLEKTTWPRAIRHSPTRITRGDGWAEAIRLQNIGADAYWLERRRGTSEEAAVMAAISAAFDASLVSSH